MVLPEPPARQVILVLQVQSDYQDHRVLKELQDLLAHQETSENWETLVLLVLTVCRGQWVRWVTQVVRV